MVKMLQNIVGVKAGRVFQLFFLKDDDQSVAVEEVEAIDFSRIIERLKQGESVFITYKKQSKSEN